MPTRLGGRKSKVTDPTLPQSIPKRKRIGAFMERERPLTAEEATTEKERLAKKQAEAEKRFADRRKAPKSSQPQTSNLPPALPVQKETSSKRAREEEVAAGAKKQRKEKLVVSQPQVSADSVDFEDHVPLDQRLRRELRTKHRHDQSVVASDP